MQHREKCHEASSLHRCQAKNKAGQPCQATIVGPDGLCTAHSGKQDMRAIGSLGGKGRKAINPDRIHEGLRAYLKREANPERVWEAIQRALEGQNESARVLSVAAPARCLVRAQF
jgi:hypothetical protein